MIRRIGYTDPGEPFNADGVRIRELITRQAGEIGNAVRGATGASQGAGDQGLMFGYATDETPERMPLPILLAHRLSAQLAKDRHVGRVGWLRPDAKTQVSVEVSRRPAGSGRDRPRQHAAFIGGEPARDRGIRSGGSASTGARRVVPQGDRRHREPVRSFLVGGPVGRRRRDGPEDHRRHVRRLRAARRRSLQREGPVEGRPERRLLLPLGGAEDRGLGPRAAGRGPGLVCDRPGRARVDDG